MADDLSRFGLAEDVLPPEWSADRLDELAVFNPETITRDYPHSQIAYLDIANVTAGVIGEALALSLASAPSRAKRIVRAHDSILSTVRPGNRSYAFLRKVPHNLVVSTGFAVLRARPEKADPRFLYYLATSDPLIDYLASIAEEKTAYPSVNPSDIAECVVPIPPIPEQRAIARILGTLDDRIELNRQMNVTLEAMAHALFKSWFVDFEPVRAMAEGRGPGLPKHLADLFPDGFEDSELGEIPAGWEVAALGTTAEVTSGKRPPVRYSEPIDGARVPLWGGNGPMAFVPAPLFQQPILLTGRVGTLGSVFRISTPCWPSDNTLVVLAKDLIAQEFLYFQMRAVDFISLNRGSTQPLLTQTDLKSQRFVLPPDEVLRQFHDLVGKLFSRMDTAESESRTLAALRDTLLPKLLSGEIRVKEAEKFVEGAV